MKLRKYDNMCEVNSTTWKKLFEISCDTSSDEKIIQALRKETDFFDDMSDEEILKSCIDGEWGDVCADGIIIWMDGVL